MAEENLFPSPIPSPDLVDLEEVTLTAEEKTITERLNWTQKFDGIVSAQRTNLVRWLLALIPFITRLLTSPGGVDVMDRIIDYLDIKDFLMLAAVTDNLLLPFVRPTSKVFKKLQDKISFKLAVGKRSCNISQFSLRFSRLQQLSTGEELLREYRLFKAPHHHWRFDNSTLFANSFVTLVEFHPTRPILAMVDQTRRLHILAYGGEERRCRGQIMFIESAPANPLNTFRAVNWSPNGSYLLALEGPMNKIFQLNGAKIRLCKFKFFFTRSKKLMSQKT
jgi:hypothetical protein